MRGAQPSTPSHEAHSTRTALEREFNPAVADCGLQGTATSPSSTANSRRVPIRGHLLRWRPRPQVQRTESTPHLRPSGAASQLTPSRHPARSSVAQDCSQQNLLANRRALRYFADHFRQNNGGGGGIRTHGRVAPTRHFQCRTFGHSATPPRMTKRLRARKNWRRGEDLNPRGTYAPIRFRVGRLQPGSATPPQQFQDLFL